MGFFAYLLGTDSKSPGAHDIAKYRHITRNKIYQILHSIRISSLTKEKEKIIEDEITKHLLSNSTISLKVIRRVLSDLVREKSINNIDKKYIYQAFEEYFFNNKENN
ncbi:MAG: hypothetical protein COX80_04020 [Candidatus Magasanikbacteria bacterium CG_4_10_14_0_2_um_filter_33_14]|uniref:Uncharacterized protein n=1 Tax=Candidatus Magasanikbacteria bacterium CG_4_10_14_0_2_um_filter_33_14 TaxID=1974636 RepID=A0A2M7V9T2_9BACT|nr:MAG: hypothetical protein COX80_04020 [Candidatus Magasanikbacteria bacterium CG_4_10_14_0_2_um_filter_33_14]